MPATELRDTPNQRRSLVALGGTVLAVIVINGLIAVFGLYFTDEENMRALHDLDRAIATLNTARSAEVHFKRQVQEWKNTLLRGDDRTDYAKYREAFRREQETTRRMLQALLASDGPLPTERIQELLQGHQALEQRYAQALTASPTLLTDARAIDAQVRGIDRPLADSFESLVVEINQQVDATRAAGRAADAGRYAALRRLVTGATGVGVLLVLILLIVALRVTNR